MEKILPLSSRLIPVREREYFSAALALIGENDKPFVKNVNDGLYERGFDIYLGGEIVENAFDNSLAAYSRIDLYALTETESNRRDFVRMLNGIRKRGSPDQWVHFGQTVQVRVGWHIKDIRLGSQFFCTPLVHSEDNLEFILDAAMYDGHKPAPTQIHLSFISSLKDFKIVW